MRNKKIVGVILFAGVIGWYFWLKSTPQALVVQDKMAVEIPKNTKKSEAVTVSEVLSDPYTHPKVYSQIKRVQNLHRAMSSGFEYYGRVIDQHGNPVVGAKVKAEWAYFPFIPNGDFGPNYKTLHLTTDSDGRFSIQKDDGMSIAIDAIEKEGYQIKSKKFYMFSDGGYKMLQSFNDPENPVIFHAWKKAEAEPLIYSEGFYGFYKSGEPYTIDLNKGKKVKGVALGDLLITFNRDPSGSRMNPSSWAVSVKAIGGGIVETTDLFMNEAPDEGYEPSWNISFKKGAGGFLHRIEKHFYLKSRSGKSYSKVIMIFWPYYRADADAIEIKAWVNPNGSRNLQYDRSKRIQ